MQKRTLAILLLSISFLAAALITGCYTSEPIIVTTPTPRADRLDFPPEPENPTQIELGEHVYFQVCMACHGDMGQGLTDEWRDVWKEDMNCWKAKCHGKDHPPYGFEIEKTCCPDVFGNGALESFDNAQELFDYNWETMPWWNPGYLTREEFWQVTAYMMHVHGALPEGVVLDDGNAHAFKLRPPSPLPGDGRPDIWLISGLLALIAGVMLLQRRFGA